MRIRSRLSFANVTSMLALFIALGGTSYAAVTLTANSVNKGHLRTNSVGKSEIRSRSVGPSETRTNAIGASEVRANAIDTDEVRDEGLQVADLAPAARTALADLNAVTFRASGTANGALTSGNVRSLARTGPGVYTVETGRDVSACSYSVSITGVKNGTTIEEPTAPGFATASPSGINTQVIVRTYDNDATPGGADDRPFSLLVAC